MAIYNFATASQWITQENTANLVTAICSNSISVDESDDNGQTLLMLACQGGKEEIVDELLRLGANVNLADGDDWTPLINAGSEGHYDIVVKLVYNRCDLEARDMGGWTALMWSCYKGYSQIAHYLLEQGASPNVWDQYSISCLAWASGKGHEAIVNDLLHHGAKVNYGDKYGSTPLLWASRKGHKSIVKGLLQHGANVDMTGMFSWTPLMVATKGNFSEVVELLLEYKPNVNAVDRESCTALTIACKEGFTDIAISFMNAAAYINLQARNGDTNLIHATKAGHFAIVDALIKKYADIDLQGEDGKTALYWACERNFSDICRLLLTANPNLELATKDGDTPLLRATRNRNIELVHLLMEHNAKVSATDKKGDNALHISMRARSKGIVEVLLRNPKNSQLLYRPNRNRETPYNIDSSYQKPILSQVFGARRLNTNEDNENLLGYDLYSSALADSLSEPSLTIPISIGLYAKWGSGKSFLLNKLRSEMHNFTYQPLDQSFKFSWILLLVLLVICSTVGIAATMAFDHWMVGVFIALGIFIFTYIFLGFINYSSKHYDFLWSYNMGAMLSDHLKKLKTFFKVLFCNPPKRIERQAFPVRFLFASQTKITGSGDQTSVSQIIVQLWQVLEKEFGFFTTRFCRVLSPKFVDSRRIKWRSICCLPTFIIGVAAIVFIYSSAVLLFLLFKYPELTFVKPMLYALAVILGILVVTNFYTIVRLAKNLLISNSRRVSHIFAQGNNSLDSLKTDIARLSLTAKILDSFVGQQTRMVIIVDGLDSCEPEKVLKLLDHIQVIFFVEHSPFVTILALDPHIIIRAVESNINYRPVTGSDYLRNIVHLPFYLQNSGLRKVKAAQMSAQLALKRNTNYWNEERESSSSYPHMGRKSSTSSGSVPEPFRKTRKGGLKIKASDSVASSINNLHHGMVGAQDLTKVLLTDDYFSDINPRSMRRLLNIVYITGRLMKAFNIEFRWYHLASWINITERWPTRTSWIILYFELHETEFEETTPLKVIYEKVKPTFPDFHDHLFKEDHDERKFEVLLAMHSTSLMVSDLKMFLPFTINLDPYIRKTIQEENQHLTISAKESTSSSKQIKKSDILRKESLPKLSSRPLIASKKPSKTSQISFSNELVIVQPPDEESFSSKEKLKHSKPIRLSVLSVEEVSNYVSKIKHIDPNRVPSYQQAITSNNINGMVLLHCDLQELKQVLFMTFGDWELFKLHMLNLREIEANYSDSDEEQSIKTFLTVVDSAKPRATVLEKQVTMEESMLFSALETLNEEAQEDTQEERLHQPELIEYTEDQLMIDDRMDHLTEPIVGSFSDTADVDILYIRSPRDSPLPPIGASLSSSIVDIESGLSHKHAPSQPIDIVGNQSFNLGGSLASSPSSRVMANLESQAVYFRTGGQPQDIQYRSSGSFSSVASSLEKLQKTKAKSSTENKTELINMSSGMNINCSLENFQTDNLLSKPVLSPEELDDSPSDDENTPLVSPNHSVMLPTTDNLPRLESNLESSQRRFPFERQFSVQLPGEHSRSMTPERNLRPSQSLSATLIPKTSTEDVSFVLSPEILQHVSEHTETRI